jgi:hypothetical protein
MQANDMLGNVPTSVGSGYSLSKKMIPVKYFYD